MWKLGNTGVGQMAERSEDGKILVRIFGHARGCCFFRYDSDFKMIEAGIVPTVKAVMEKFNG